VFIAGFEGGDGVCEIGLCIHFPSNELCGFDEQGNGGCGGMEIGWYELKDGRFGAGGGSGRRFGWPDKGKR